MRLNNPSSIKIYAYNENLELINGKPFYTILQKAEFLGINKFRIEIKLKKKAELHTNIFTKN